MRDQSLSRRAVTIGGGVAATIGLAAVGLTVRGLFVHRYAKTPYDDLFALLIDRGEAVKLGKVVLEQVSRQPVREHDFTPAETAVAIRQSLGRRTLAEVTDAELAEGKIIEVKGWVMPLTLVLLCMLAAMVE
jgi:hypothetical protein